MKHQLIAGTYTVFPSAKECKAAFERAKELGLTTNASWFIWQEGDKYLLCSISGDGTVSSFNDSWLLATKNEGYKLIPTIEFLARMENKWEYNAENAQSNQLTLPEAIAKLEAEGWYFRTIDSMWFGKMDGNMCLLSESMGFWQAIIVDYTIDPNNTNQIMPSIQEALEACETLNNAKPE